MILLFKINHRINDFLLIITGPTVVHVCVIVYNGHRRVTFVDTPPAKGLGDITEKGGADLAKERWGYCIYSIK